MFLKNVKNGDLVEVLAMDQLVDPGRESVSGRYHAGEEMQESEEFSKSELTFPSGESLPRCWIDAHYRD